jgi:hypothetical protein
MADDALSSDDDADAVDPVQQARRAPKKVSKRAAAREAASGATRRSPAFTIPTPINYKSDGAGGVQQYRLPDETRVYQRREFNFDDTFKVGPLMSVRPGPPTLFSDKYLFIKAKKRLVAERDPDEEVLDSRAKLVRRLEARIVRVSQGYFISQDLGVGAAD